jgi:hypothetical protein
MPVVLASGVRQSKRRRRAAVDGEDFVSGPLCEAICVAHGNLPSQHPDDVLRRHASCHRGLARARRRKSAATSGSGTVETCQPAQKLSAYRLKTGSDQRIVRMTRLTMPEVAPFDERWLPCPRFCTIAHRLRLRLQASKKSECAGFTGFEFKKRRSTRHGWTCDKPGSVEIGRSPLDSRTAAAIAGSGVLIGGTAWKCSHPPPSAL